MIYNCEVIKSYQKKNVDWIIPNNSLNSNLDHTILKSIFWSTLCVNVVIIYLGLFGAGSFSKSGIWLFACKKSRPAPHLLCWHFKFCRHNIFDDFSLTGDPFRLTCDLIFANVCWILLPPPPSSCRPANNQIPLFENDPAP